MAAMAERDFKFYVPIELVKSSKDGDDEEWQIQGIASTPDEDLQGETVDQDGLDISLLKAGRGLFNFDHQKGPENVLGQVEDADFVERDGKKCLMVKGYLFKHQDRAKAMRSIMKSVKKGSAPRVQMSIEGKILQRDFANNKAIKKARIDKVALTLDPVNPYTYADLCKSLASPDPVEPQAATVEVTLPLGKVVEVQESDLKVLLDFVQKALSAGVGGTKAPGARTSGESMTRESLDGSPKPTTFVSKRKERKGVVRSLVKSLQEMYPSHDPSEIATMVIESLVDRVDDSNEGEK